jgi:hypothetical protein
VQLFLVPGLIVAGAVAVLLGFSWLSGGSRTPEQFLKNIESANADIRWRAASDLAQVLKRDEALAADASFGLRLAEKLRLALDDLDKAEESLRAVPAGEPHHRTRTEAQKKLIAQRNYVQYLGACLGNFTVPVGAPLLIELARNGRGQDVKLRALVRRQAVWALANLGNNRRRFPQLKNEQRAQARHQLEQEARAASESGTWAAAALAFLDGKSLGVIDALAECAKEPTDIFLRVQVAHALGFWDGDERERKLAEDTLLVLARDVGKGERIVVNENE